MLIVENSGLLKLQDEPNGCSVWYGRIITPQPVLVKLDQVYPVCQVHAEISSKGGFADNIKTAGIPELQRFAT